MSARLARRAGVPPDYERFNVGTATVVALRAEAASVREALRCGTLYEYAEQQYGTAQADARAYFGRAPAFAVALPASRGGATRVVVRHSRHGGLLAPLTGDRFLTPTRAPRELDSALRLRQAGVPTPEIVAYALYPAGPLLRRADVATREVPGGRDLATVLGPGRSNAGSTVVQSSNEAEKCRALEAVGALLRSLAAAGARHPDLNARNVLLAPGRRGFPSFDAFVLDVDRVVFGEPSDRAIAEANYRRLARSLRKLQLQAGLRISPADVAWLASSSAVSAPGDLTMQPR